ncbi:MAG: dolichyl-phosphate beta-glucosyltransferase [Patescibacteria group bacterium]|nr:dolichyl-phosphate beta-glucosyltransferase [Patescibacteria group bacterium]
MIQSIHLSLIIPTYNEEKRIIDTLKKIDKYLSHQSYDYEIIVVNDGSKDNTAEIVKKIIPEIKNLELIDNIKNNGKGFVVRQGIKRAKGEYIIFTDADNSTDIKQIEKIFAEFEKGYKVIIGSRDIKGAVIAVPQPWWRIALGNIFNLIVQIISGLYGIWDTQCGFKGFTKQVAQDIFSKCEINRFAFDVEVLAIAKKMKYKIKEIPIIWINSTESKVGFKSMVKMLFEVIKVRYNLITRKYDKKK